MIRIYRNLILCSSLALLFASIPLRAQDPQNPVANAPENRHMGQEGGPRPTFGKITAMQNGSLQITTPDGSSVTVKLTEQTQFRKDREQAALSDFKVGDVIMVRGEENPDHSITARVVGARSAGAGGPGGPGGGRGGPGGPMQMGTLGKDYVIGEVKSIDAPRLTILRPDNVSQTIELNENTSLRKGRDSVTMADIQVGDHVMARGALENNGFVPKGVMVMNPEQWKRMQEMRGATSNDAPPAPPSQPPATSDAPQAKPASPPN